MTRTRLCAAADVPPDEPLRVDVDGVSYAVYRVGDAYYVSADFCSHGPGRLSEGYLEDYEIECPFHQGRFDIRTGAPTAAPCFEPVQVWQPTIADGDLFIEIAAKG